jgi:hypothetical protein
MTSPDIPILIYKLRNAPQLVGTFGRGDPDPLEQYRLVMTGEERDWLIGLAEQASRARFGERLYTLKEATTALEQAIQTLSLTRQEPQS